jgi:hypothetical protein
MDTSVYILAYVFDDDNGKGSSYGDGALIYINELTISYGTYDTYDYGSVPLSVLDLDSGYCGTVIFETRWYGTADSYADYVTSFVVMTVDTTRNGPCCPSPK